MVPSLVRSHARHLLALIFLLPILARVVMTDEGKPAAGYVGSETCKDCHSEIFSNFEKTPHWKTTFNKAGAEGCESCHGPGKAHVEAGGDPAKIFTFAGKSPAAVAERCLSCHQYGQEHSNFLRSTHRSQGVTCLSCHSPHHFREAQFLLVKAQTQLCLGCHTDVKPDFLKPFHHRVQEGLVRCTDCHNQHGSMIDAQLRSSPARDSVCLNCHAEKSGPFVFEHAPQRTEGCTSCHVPHGSANPRMLKRSQVNLLCLECHTVTFGSAVHDAPGFHDQAAQFQACTLCHVSIHGSNFSRVFFK